MDNQSPAAGSSSTEPKGKRHRRSGKPSGPQTAPAMPQNVAPQPKPTPPTPKVVDAFPGEPPEDRLANANAALKAALARYQSLGGVLMTINEPGASWIQIRGLKFKAPNTANIDMEVVNEQKPPQAPK